MALLAHNRLDIGSKVWRLCHVRRLDRLRHRAPPHQPIDHYLTVNRFEDCAQFSFSLTEPNSFLGRAYMNRAIPKPMGTK
jgi:hypothetical protein